MRRVGWHGRRQSRRAGARVHLVTVPAACGQSKRRAPCRLLGWTSGLEAVVNIRFAVVFTIQLLQNPPWRRRQAPATEAGERRIWREKSHKRGVNASGSPSANFGQRQTVVGRRLGESARAGRPFEEARRGSIAPRAAQGLRGRGRAIHASCNFHTALGRVCTPPTVTISVFSKVRFGGIAAANFVSRGCAWCARTARKFLPSLASARCSGRSPSPSGR